MWCNLILDQRIGILNDVLEDVADVGQHLHVVVPIRDDLLHHRERGFEVLAGEVGEVDRRVVEDLHPRQERVSGSGQLDRGRSQPQGPVRKRFRWSRSNRNCAGHGDGGAGGGIRTNFLGHENAPSS